MDGNGNPVSWYMDAYGGLHGAEFSVEQTADGPAAHIVNVEAKDARYAQTVKVAPDAIYRLHGYIRASAEGGRGANLSVEGIYLFTDPLFDTAGEWTELGDFHPAPAYCDEYITMYMARGLHKGARHLDEDEFLDVYAISLSDLVEDVMAGRISDAKTQVCILKAARILGL